MKPGKAQKIVVEIWFQISGKLIPIIYCLTIVSLKFIVLMKFKKTSTFPEYSGRPQNSSQRIQYSPKFSQLRGFCTRKKAFQEQRTKIEEHFSLNFKDKMVIKQYIKLQKVWS